MEQQIKNQGLLGSFTKFIKSHKKILFTFGLTFVGVAIGKSLCTKRVNPDIKKVLQLMRTIEKSLKYAQQSLEPLQVEKKILTQYGKQKDNTNENELNMMFLLITRLKLKQKNKEKQLRNPFLPPFEQGLFISELQPTHRLLYNKFNIYDNHLLVVTKQFEPQSNQLTQADFKQSLLVLKALDGLLFFNSGPQAGSSQTHKHVQIFPHLSFQLPIVKQLMHFAKQKSNEYNFENQSIIEFPGFDFIHGLVLLNPEVNLSIAKKRMHKAYKKILQQRIQRIKAAAYNIIAAQEFILVVGRSKQRAFDEIPINAVGIFCHKIRIYGQHFIQRRIKTEQIYQFENKAKQYIRRYYLLQKLQSGGDGCGSFEIRRSIRQIEITVIYFFNVFYQLRQRRAKLHLNRISEELLYKANNKLSLS